LAPKLPQLAEASRAARGSSLPAHLIPLGHESWALWRLLAVRGPGFPIAELLKLAAPACATAADQHLAAEAESSASGGAASPATLESFRQTYNQAVVQISTALYATAQTSRFQEAVIWQNRQAFHNMVERLVLPPAAGTDLHYRNSQQRRREETVASYLQRYCAKNETIGFFGPAGWGKFVPEGRAIAVDPGPQGLLAKRQVYFEEWGIGSLARKLSRSKALRPWIAPQRHPFIYAGATGVRLPGDGAVAFSREEAAVLQRCDGRRLAREIAADLVSWIDATAVYEILARLEAQGLLTWYLRIQIETNPEEALHAALARVEDDKLRTAALAELTELERRRAAVAQAAGQPQQLDRALADLETAFVRLTGEDAARLPGNMFVGRTLVYEDCVRDLAVEIGPEIRAVLAEPLALLFTSARWFSWQLAAIYATLFRELYDAAVAETGRQSIPVTDLWDKLAPRLLAPGQPAVQALRRELQQRWAAILGLPSGQPRLAYTAAALRPQVSAAFAAPRPGWTLAHYASADILIDATSLDGIQRGEYQAVVGDFHASNTLGQSFHLFQYPDPDEIVRDCMTDLPGGLWLPVMPTGGRLTPRVSFGPRRPDDVWLQMAPEAAVNPQYPAVALGELLLEDGPAGELVLRTRDGRLAASPPAVFAFPIMLQMLQNYTLFGAARHIPRLTVDRVVIQRETWHMAASDIAFAGEADEALRFLAARRWARQQAIPRFVFARLPHEDKPFYTDLDSPVFVNILAKGIRAAQRARGTDAPITVMEMLPTPEGAWLPDAEGRRYTSELRLVALDLATDPS